MRRLVAEVSRESSRLSARACPSTTSWSKPSELDVEGGKGGEAIRRAYIGNENVRRDFRRGV